MANRAKRRQVSECLQAAVCAALLAMAAAAGSLVAGRGQDAAVVAEEIVARGRVFPEIGPGVTALKRDAAGRYYVLAAPANTIRIYGPDGKPAGQIPNARSGGAKIVYAEDIDIDPAGHLYVADRGANAVKIFDADGSLEATVPVTAPTSLAALSGGEFAVAAWRSNHLVDILDWRGKLVRDFGDLSASGAPDATNPSAKADLQLFNRGRVSGDPAGHIYFTFTYLPEPTFRKYDRYGYAAYVVSLSASEFPTKAQPQPGEFVTFGERGGAPAMKPVIGALAADPATQEVWAALGDELLHFDKDGNRLASYRTATREGAPIEARAILVEPEHILLAADPFGIFDFARPDKLPVAAAPMR